MLHTIRKDLKDIRERCGAHTLLIHKCTARLENPCSPQELKLLGCARVGGVKFLAMLKRQASLLRFPKLAVRGSLAPELVGPKLQGELQPWAWSHAER